MRNHLESGPTKPGVTCSSHVGCTESERAELSAKAETARALHGALSGGSRTLLSVASIVDAFTLGQISQQEAGAALESLTGSRIQAAAALRDYIAQTDALIAQADEQLAEVG